MSNLYCITGHKDKNVHSLVNDRHVLVARWSINNNGILGSTVKLS